MGVLCKLGFHRWFYGLLWEEGSGFYPFSRTCGRCGAYQEKVKETGVWVEVPSGDNE